MKKEKIESNYYLVLGFLFLILAFYFSFSFIKTYNIFLGYGGIISFIFYCWFTSWSNNMSKIYKIEVVRLKKENEN